MRFHHYRHLTHLTTPPRPEGSGGEGEGGGEGDDCDGLPIRESNGVSRRVEPVARFPSRRTSFLSRAAENSRHRVSFCETVNQ